MKITRQEVVISFEIDQAIVLTCGNAIKDAQKKMGGQILSINAPDDAPPSMPRVILKLKDTIVNIAFDRIQITTIPPSHVSDSIDKSSKYTLQRIIPFLSELLPSIPEYFWAGVITEIEYYEDPLKSNSANEAVTPVFNKLINVDRKNKELSAFQLQYGIKDNDQYFVTYTISGFESRKVEFKIPPKMIHYVLEPSEHLLTNCGVRILLDTNNRPNKQNEDPRKDIEDILSKQNSLAMNLAKDLNLQGVLS